MTTMTDAEFFNKLAPTWDSTRERQPQLLQQLTAKLELKPRDRVLDLGSGTGVLLPYLAPQAAQVTAVDFAEAMLELAARNHAKLTNITYLHGDILELALPAASFEQITCLNFYPHVKDSAVFLSKAAGLLVPGGKLTIMHDIPRSAVNAIHGACAQVQDDNLPPAAVVAQRLTDVGLQVLYQEDTENYYFVQGVKP